MTRAKLISHVAAETSTTKAAAERIVGAMFSALADALARDDTVAISGFGKSAVRGSARVRDAIPDPASRPASRRRRCRRSSRRKPFATRSTKKMTEQATTYAPSVSAMRPPQMCAFEPRICKTSFLASRRYPAPFPSRAIGPRAKYTRLVPENLWQDTSRFLRTFTRARVFAMPIQNPNAHSPMTTCADHVEQQDYTFLRSSRMYSATALHLARHNSQPTHPQNHENHAPLARLSRTNSYPTDNISRQPTQARLVALGTCLSAGTTLYIRRRRLFFGH